MPTTRIVRIGVITLIFSAAKGVLRRSIMKLTRKTRGLLLQAVACQTKTMKVSYRISMDDHHGNVLEGHAAAAHNHHHGAERRYVNPARRVSTPIAHTW